MAAAVVGVAGFEPTTSCSQSRRDTGLRYTPNGVCNGSGNAKLIIVSPLRCAKVIKSIEDANFILFSF